MLRIWIVAHMICGAQGMSIVQGMLRSLDIAVAMLRKKMQ